MSGTAFKTVFAQEISEEITHKSVFQEAKVVWGFFFVCHFAFGGGGAERGGGQDKIRRVMTGGGGGGDGQEGHIRGGASGRGNLGGGWGG